MRIQQPQTRSGHHRRCRRPFTISPRPNANNWNIVGRPSSHSANSAASPLPKNSKTGRLNLPTLDDPIRSEPCAGSSLAGSKEGETASHYFPKPMSVAGEVGLDLMVSSNDSRSSGNWSIAPSTTCISRWRGDQSQPSCDVSSKTFNGITHVCQRLKQLRSRAGLRWREPFHGVSAGSILGKLIGRAGAVTSLIAGIRQRHRNEWRLVF